MYIYFFKLIYFNDYNIILPTGFASATDASSGGAFTVIESLAAAIGFLVDDSALLLLISSLFKFTGLLFGCFNCGIASAFRIASLIFSLTIGLASVNKIEKHLFTKF